MASVRTQVAEQEPGGCVEHHAHAGPAQGAVCGAVARGRDQLLEVARRRGGTRIDAEEVLQLALQRALERADQLREPSRAAAWVGRIVRNAVLDELRKQPRSSVALDVAELPARADDAAVCRCVLAQAQQLKPEYAQILRRVVVDMVPVTAVAQELGLTPNNAMVRLHRARTALKQRLQLHCGTTSLSACSDCGCEERGCCPLA